MMQQNPFGKNLYLDRYSLGLSQAAISRAINVSQQALARWENGRSIPRYGVLDRLKNFLEQEFEKINSKSLVCSMTDDFTPRSKEQKPKIELRDYFAAKAMQVILQSQYEDGIYVGDHDNVSEQVCANSAYIMADAMLKAREA
jgi:transcriptional regulator with XRE-family HTH domain